MPRFLSLPLSGFEPSTPPKLLPCNDARSKGGCDKDLNRRFLSSLPSWRSAFERQSIPPVTWRWLLTSATREMKSGRPMLSMVLGRWMRTGRLHKIRPGRAERSTGCKSPRLTISLIGRNSGGTRYRLIEGTFAPFCRVSQRSRGESCRRTATRSMAMNILTGRNLDRFQGNGPKVGL